MSTISARPLSTSQLKSVSETDDTTARLALRSPYIQVTVVSVRNLEALDQGNIEPYVVLSYGDLKRETRVMQSNEELLESFEFDINVRLQPLVVRIMDKDEYGKHSLLSAVTIPETCFARWEGRVSDLHVRIEEEGEEEQVTMATLVKELELSTKEDIAQVPHFHLQIRYVSDFCLSSLQVSFQDHFIRSTADETFTQYIVEVVRGDGYKWKTVLRFSQIEAIRKTLVGLFPEFRRTVFPRKTVLDCFSSFCSSMSRFDDTRIEQRKRGLEAFINSVLRKSQYVSDPLMDLLKVPSHRRAVSQDF